MLKQMAEDYNNGKSISHYIDQIEQDIKLHNNDILKSFLNAYRNHQSIATYIQFFLTPSLISLARQILMEDVLSEDQLPNYQREDTIYGINGIPCQNISYYVDDYLKSIAVRGCDSMIIPLIEFNSVEEENKCFLNLIKNASSAQEIFVKDNNILNGLKTGIDMICDHFGSENITVLTTYSIATQIKTEYKDIVDMCVSKILYSDMIDSKVVYFFAPREYVGVFPIRLNEDGTERYVGMGIVNQWAIAKMTQVL